MERVLRVPGLDATVVATDDERIADAVRATGADVLVSAGEFASGTDRVAAAAAQYPADVIVNVQGDELLLDAQGVGEAIERFRAADFALGTLRTPLAASGDLWNPNVVKVVIDDEERAMYFSRAPIPFPRTLWHANSAASDLSSANLGAVGGPQQAWVHIGVYLYRAAALERWAATPPSPLEDAEGLEQLRVLEAGEHMQTYLVNETIPGVNTPEDLDRAAAALAAHAPQA